MNFETVTIDLQSIFVLHTIAMQCNVWLFYFRFEFRYFCFIGSETSLGRKGRLHDDFEYSAVPWGHVGLN